MTTRIYCTPREAAALLGCHHNTVLSMLRRGVLDGEKIVDRWLLSKDSVETLVNLGYRPIVGRPQRSSDGGKNR